MSLALIVANPQNGGYLFKARLVPILTTTSRELKSLLPLIESFPFLDAPLLNDAQRRDLNDTRSLSKTDTHNPQLNSRIMFLDSNH